MKNFLKNDSPLRHFLFIPGFAAVYFALHLILSLTSAKEFLWQDWSIVSLGLGGIIWLIFGGPFPIYRPLPDAPAHPHHFRLRFIGGEGLRVVCDACRISYPLSRDVTRWQTVVFFVLFVLLTIAWNFLTDLPDPYDELGKYLLILLAIYLSQLVCWLFLRRQDPVNLLSLEDRAALREHEAPDESAC